MTASNLAQADPTTGGSGSQSITNGSISDATTVDGSGTYSITLDTTGAHGLVSYSQNQSGQSSYLSLASDGTITTTGTLPAGTYTISGTTTDAYGDTGTWSFTLTVTASGSTINQTTPQGGTSEARISGNSVSDSVDVSSSSTYSITLFPGSYSSGSYSYSASASSPAGLVISSQGTITTTSALEPGTYVLSGSVIDSSNDAGTWSFTLTVTSGTPPPLPSSGGTYIEFTPGTGGYIGPNGQVETATVTQPTSSSIQVSANGLTMTLEPKTEQDGKLTNGELTLYQGAQGQSTGSGFMPGTEVAVYAFSTPTLLAVVPVQQNGQFVADFNVPSTLEVGSHTIQASGIGYDGLPASLSAGVWIDAVLVAAGLPASVVQGVLAYTGFGFDMGFWFALSFVGGGTVMFQMARRRRLKKEL